MGTPKTGGRKRGTPNRVTTALEEKLNAIGCDPVIELAKIAMNAKNPLEIRVRCLIEIAPYVFPKRRPVDGSTDESKVINVTSKLDSSAGGCDGSNQHNPSA